MTEETWVTVKSSRTGPASAVCYQSVIWSGIKSSEKQNDRLVWTDAKSCCSKSQMATKARYRVRTCCHRTHLAQCLLLQNHRLKINPEGINCRGQEKNVYKCRGGKQGHVTEEEEEKGQRGRDVKGGNNDWRTTNWTSRRESVFSLVHKQRQSVQLCLYLCGINPWHCQHESIISFCTLKTAWHRIGFIFFISVIFVSFQISFYFLLVSVRCHLKRMMQYDWVDF